MRHLVLLFAAFIGPAGCLIASDTDDRSTSTPSTPTPSTPTPHHNPPPGCKRTACDVEADQCRADARASCIKCSVDCGTVPIEYQSQCIASCATLCSITDKDAARCYDAVKSCRASSPRNGFCADGVADSCIPLRSSASQLPMAIASHRGACTNADVIAFMDACFAPKGTSSACQGFASNHPACRSCASGSTGVEPLWSPKPSKWVWINRGLCVALRGDTDCGRAVFAADTCVRSACATCEDPDACTSAANILACADVSATMQACVGKLSAEVRADCDLSAESAEFNVVGKEMIALVCGS